MAHSIVAIECEVHIRDGLARNNCTTNYLDKVLYTRRVAYGTVELDMKLVLMVFTVQTACPLTVPTTGTKAAAKMRATIRPHQGRPLFAA